MNRTVFTAVFLVLVVVVGLSHVRAGVFRRPYHRSSVRAGVRRDTTGYKHTSRECSGFPKTAWDLGNHLGEWPPYLNEHHRH